MKRSELIILRTGSLAVAVAVAASAAALSFKDISGKWCSEAGDYNFRRDLLIATFHDGTPTRRLKVSGYDYRDDKIIMYWFYKGEKLYTEFGEFGADSRTMAQLEGESGPRRAFHRC